MPSAEYEATPKEVRNFALPQIGLAGGLLVLLFFMLGGSDADHPPAWLAVALVVPIAIGACFAALLPGVIAAFVGDYGGWPLVIVGFPGIAVIMWETWPSLHNTSLTAAMLDSQGAQSHLVESFIES